MKKEYLDPARGLWSRKKMALKFGIPESKIKIEETELHQRTKPQPARARRKKYHQIITYPNRDDRLWNIQGDIMEFYSRDRDRVQHNYGFKYILVFICAYSRFCWAFPMKKKNTKWIYEKTEAIMRKYRPFNLSFDRESGIRSRKVMGMLRKYDIKLWHAEEFQPGGKMSTSLVERMNQTLRNLLRKVEIQYPNSVLIDHLDTLVANYNETPHMGLPEMRNGKKIYRTPKDVFEKQDYKQILRDVPEIVVGSTVRVLEKKKAFGKGRQEWSKKVYTVTERLRNKYKLVHKGATRRGLVGPQDLQVVHSVTDTIEKAEPLPEAEGGEPYIPDWSELSE